jgi:double-stranded uracil-DNA glycosylase
MAKQPARAARACGFPPISDRKANVLVLGSMPSVASITKRQYYAHPRNAFWQIMGRLFGAGPDVPYRERRKLLRGRKLAVWDVLQECYRVGSLDMSIHSATETPNDFVAFFQRHPHIHTVFFNGGKAESAFRRHAIAGVNDLGRDLTYVRLPSTSPAHAGRSFAEKLKAWRRIEQALDTAS